MEEKKVKTAPSKKATDTAREVWPYVKEDYALGHQRKAEGKPIVWKIKRYYNEADQKCEGSDRHHDSCCCLLS